MDVNLSKIKVSPISNPRKKGLIALVSFAINESFFVGNLELYASFGSSWKKIAYPVDQKNKGYFYPISKEVQEYILCEIENEYKRLTKEGGD